MDFSQPKFKALTVTFGLSLWVFIFTSASNIFSIEYYSIFVIGIFTITQVLSKKLSKALEVFAIINTKIFLGILFIFKYKNISRNIIYFCNNNIWYNI